VVTRSLGIPTKQIPPKPYIRVGYKDKGTRRDPSWDGSPSWQEVAMANTEKLKWKQNQDQRKCWSFWTPEHQQGTSSTRISLQKSKDEEQESKNFSLR
jgi:hypothetical protein